MGLSLISSVIVVSSLRNSIWIILQRLRKSLCLCIRSRKCILNLNDTWVNQEVKPNQLNEIDLTGYARKGVNLLFASFPFVEGKKQFAARVIVEYYNYDRIEFSTDSSWFDDGSIIPTLHSHGCFRNRWLRW